MVRQENIKEGIKMPEILKIAKDTLEMINPYLKKEYFLGVIGSIFLLGIVGQWITKAVYGRLIKKAENMVSPKNKMLKQIKMKFENCKTVNGVVANPTLMVERYIKKYRFLGITLGGMSRFTKICAVLCLVFGGAVALVIYEMSVEKSPALFYAMVSVFVAFALDICARSSGIEEREGELICIITDFLENTLNCKARRQERTAETLKMMEEAEAREQEGAGQKIVSFHRDEGKISAEDKFKENFEPEILHKSLEEEGFYEQKADIDALREQEYIISEVLGEFL